MTGLEKIIGKIGNDSAEKCVSIIADANAKAERILKAAQDECEKVNETVLAEIKTEGERAKELAESAANQKSRQTLLAARIEAINEALAQASLAIKNLPADKYFSALTALAVSNAMPGSGVMRLSKGDLQRLPDGFEKNINSKLSDRNISVSDKPADISDGFILVYGDIEINCTVDALIDEKRDELKEKICSIIF
ncbi:MAG: hypothetical protein K5756_09050 [Clostridiales bacterium]|nr:hypothetical protein [Clostridiales bacterium]